MELQPTEHSRSQSVRPLPGRAGRSCSLAESNWKGALGVKLPPSTFPTAYHIPDFFREHLRTALINIKTKDMPKEGRKVNVGTSNHPEPEPGPEVPLSRGRRKPHTIVAERDCFSVQYSNKALDGGGGVGGGRFQKQWKALILKTKMLSSIFLLGSSTCQGRTGMRRRSGMGWLEHPGRCL